MDNISKETYIMPLPEERNYKNDLLKLIPAFEKKLIEREPFIRTQLLFMFAKHHYFYIGEPGVGKTYFCKTIFSCVIDAVFWEIQMTKGTTEKKLWGEDLSDPLSLVNAHFVFFDEMYKGQDEILVSLLSFLNERYYTLNGKAVKVNLVCAVGASNEFPQGEMVKPFDDRFMGRDEIKRIQTRENRKKFINKQFDMSKDLPLYLCLDDIDYCYEEATKIVMTEEFESIYLKLMETTIKEGVDCSDRKYGHAISILKMSAFLNNRTELDLSDIFIMEHIAWSNYTDRTNMRRILSEVMYGNKNEIIDKLKNIEKDSIRIVSLKNSDYKNVLEYSHEFSGKTKETIFISARDGLNNILIQLNTELDKLEDIIRRYEEVISLEEKVNENIFIYKEKNNVYTQDILEKIKVLYDFIKHNSITVNDWLLGNRNLSDYEDKYYVE